MVTQETVNFDHNGVTYRFDFGTNCACRMEERFPEQTFVEMMRDLRTVNPRVSMVRAYVKAGLVEPEKASDEQIGGLIDAMGGWGPFLATIESEAPEAIAAQLTMANDALRARIVELERDLIIARTPVVETPVETETEALTH